MHQKPFKNVIVFSGLLLMVSGAFSGPLEAPPGMFKDLDDKIVGEAIIINGKQIFIDDYIIDELKGAKKVLNQPVKHPRNPLLVRDKPWEESDPGYSTTVIYDKQEHIFKMWYETIGKGGTVKTLSYATSKDGINWQKPIINSEKGTNFCFLPEVAGFLLPSVFKDPGDPDPKRRYKMKHVASPGEDAGIDRQGYLSKLQTSVSFSPDGIHWTLASEVQIPFSDTPSSTFWDSRLGRYVSYLRYGPPNSRVISRIESEDFIHWSPKVTLFTSGLWNKLDAPFQTLHYRMSASPYEGYYIGLIAAYHGETIKEIPPEEQSWRDKVNLQLTYSRNGVTWMRIGRNGAFIPPRTADDTGKPIPDDPADANRDWKMEADKAVFLPYGEHKKNWDWGSIYPGNQPDPIIVDDQIRFYYTGYPNRHGGQYHGDINEPYGGKSGIGLATLRLDGFVSVDAGQEEGILATKPLVFIGDALEINANAQGGSIQVEALDGDGKVIEGFAKSDCEPLIDDKVHHIVKWKAGTDCHLLQARPIRLKFYLKNAKLYSFKPRILYNHYIPSYD